jgi:hypothetical protein
MAKKNSHNRKRLAMYWDCDHCEERYPYEHEGYTPYKADIKGECLWLCHGCMNEHEEKEFRLDAHYLARKG